MRALAVLTFRRVGLKPSLAPRECEEARVTRRGGTTINGHFIDIGHDDDNAYRLDERRRRSRLPLQHYARSQAEAARYGQGPFARQGQLPVVGGVSTPPNGTIIDGPFADRGLIYIYAALSQYSRGVNEIYCP